MKLKPFDFVIASFFIFVIAISWINLFSKKEGKAELLVKTPKGEFVYSLDKNIKLEFEGVIGKTFVTIEDGKAFVTESACENKNCVGFGKLYRNNDFAACLPNGIILRIENQSEENNLDALVQ